MKIIDYIEEKTKKTSDKDLKIYSVLCVVIGVLLILIGAIAALFSVPVFIILLALGIFSINLRKTFGLIIDKREKLRKDEEFKNAFDKRFAKNGINDLDLLPEKSNGYVLKYVYERDICFIDKENINLVIDNAGKQIEFEKEPDNPYDENAVKINFNGFKLGYVYKGQTQDMINDWIDRQWPTCAYINRYDINEGKATYKVGFYMPSKKNPLEIDIDKL